MVDYKKNLRAYLDREIAVIQELDLDSINVVMNVLEEAKANHKNHIYLWKWWKCSDSKSFCL